MNKERPSRVFAGLWRIMVFLLSPVLIMGCQTKNVHLREPVELYDGDYVSREEKARKAAFPEASQPQGEIEWIYDSTRTLYYHPTQDPIPLTLHVREGIGDVFFTASPDVLLRVPANPTEKDKYQAFTNRRAPEDSYAGVPVVNRYGSNVTVYVDVKKLPNLMNDQVVISAVPMNSENEGDSKGKDLMLTVLPMHGELSTKLHVWPPETAAQEFGKYFAEAFYVCDVNFINNSMEDILVYGASLKTEVAYAMTAADAAALAADYPDVDPAEFEYSEFRRPMCFSDVLAVFEYQRESTTRQQVLRWLQFAGTVAAGAGIFVNHTDYATGTAFYNGIFLPEFEKRLLWDILMHLRNLESRSLKEIEEIPTRGQLHRIVFFPRSGIIGLNPKKPMYIAEIWPDAVARAESIAKLGSTADERAAALTAIMAKSAVTRNAQFTDSQVYKDALVTLVTAKQAHDAAMAANKQEDADERARNAALKSSVAGLINQIIQNPETRSETAQSLVQLLVNYAAGLDAPADPE